MARFGEQVGGVPESLGPTKRGGRGRSIAVVARRRDKLGWSGQGGGHREICFPAEGLKETRQVKVEGKVLWGRSKDCTLDKRTDQQEAVGRGMWCVFVGACKNSEADVLSLAFACFVKKMLSAFSHVYHQ